MSNDTGDQCTQGCVSIREPVADTCECCANAYHIRHGDSRADGLLVGKRETAGGELLLPHHHFLHSLPPPDRGVDEVDAGGDGRA